MQLKKTLTILIILILFGCQKKETKTFFREPKFIPMQSEVVKNINGFSSPFLSYNTKILFLGKFHFSDTSVHLEKDSVEKYYLDARDNNIDQLNNIANTDTISSTGLEFKVGRKPISVMPFLSRETKSYYPAFLINNTKESKIINGQGTRMFGIQEAIDSSLYHVRSNQNHWFSISLFDPPMCGSGFWSIKIQPKEYAIILLPKYEGNKKTLLRAKIKINNSIFTTAPFSGHIEQNQFITKDSSLFKMAKSDLSHREKYFFDSEIKELSYYFGK